MSLKEFIQYRMYSTLEKERHRIEMELNSNVMVKENKRRSTCISSEIQELEHQLKLSIEKERLLSKELSLSESSKQEMERRMEASIRKYQSLSTNAHGYDELYEEKKRLEEECSRLKLQVEQTTTVVASSSTARDRLQRDFQDSNRKLEMIRADKEYLQRENTEMKSKRMEWENRCERLEEECCTLKKEKEVMMEEFRKLKEEYRVEYQVLMYIESVVTLSIYLSIYLYTSTV